MKKIRVLVVLRYLSSQGGLQRVVNSYYERFNRDRFHIDYLVLDHVDSDFETTVLKSGSQIFDVAGIRERNPLLLIRESKNFFKTHNDYDIIHCHQTNFDFVFLYYARRNGIPVRILHSHSTHADIPGLQLRMERIGANSLVTHKMGCSLEAGKFLFGDSVENDNRFFVLNNAFDVCRYEFNQDDRKAIRQQYEIADDTILVGQIGRLSIEKRHVLSLRVVRELKDRGIDVKFLIVGDGDLRSVCEEAAQDLGLEKDAIFAGSLDSVIPVLSALDVFLMPSEFEGVPVALLEAFANGRPVVITDSINTVIEGDEGVVRVARDADVERWADGIVSAANVKLIDKSSRLKDVGYDIDSQVSRLSDLYYELASSVEE